MLNLFISHQWLQRYFAFAREKSPPLFLHFFLWARWLVTRGVYREVFQSSCSVLIL